MSSDFCLKPMLTENEWETIKQEIQMLLHAHRDCLRNQGKDTKNILFDARDGYYGEAFGILRTLALLGYGTLDQPCNIPEIRTNLHWWFYKIQREVLMEEGFFNKTYFCQYCKDRYGKG